VSMAADQKDYPKLFRQLADLCGDDEVAARGYRDLADEIDRLRAFARDLLDPEGFGHAVTAEVRNAARRVLGISASEAKPVVVVGSFNESSARRDALAWPRGSLGEDVAP
jgi:hypothetical protein